MTNPTITAERAAHTVNAVCVDLEDLGTRETHYGQKHQIRFTFETDEKTDSGEPLFVTRTYNLSMHEWATLRTDMESWNGKKFTSDEEAEAFKLRAKINEQCQLKLVPHTSHDYFYWNIDRIKPGKTEVKPSGLYQRRR